MDAQEKKKSLPELEEEIVKFWEDNKIFEKSVLQRKGKKRFVFYDGPPFATGLPHYGHILSSTVKDVVPRYWAMKGYYVPRRWGWDCHGLPIENIVEEELNLSGRKSIEKFGIQKFNEAARSKVLTYVNEWRKTVRRMGRFVDFENSYATMDLTYMESIWRAFKTLYEKKLIYKDSRTALFCPRCETALSNFEIAMDNSYREQEDDSVYVKFELAEVPGEYFLIWTTTPWTLPGNAGIAVHPDIEYTKYRIRDAILWAAVAPPHEAGEIPEVLGKAKGSGLVGKRYKPFFNLTSDENAYRVVAAEFVSTEEGTGLVHIAPAFGEEDFRLGKKEKLPMIETLDNTGHFGDSYQELSFLKGKTAAGANPALIECLKEKGILWKVQKITHRYPICWRCSAPLIYKVEPAWFLNIQKIKKRMLALNQKIDWHPKHLKDGRFGNGLETAPDWNLSRSRFWGTPIPIWECAWCKKIRVVGSRDEFAKRAKPAKNRYILMRHGESETNVKGIISYDQNAHYPLTLRGRKQVERASRLLKKKKIDVIVSSDVLRTKETAQIVGDAFGLGIQYDPRFREVNTGMLEGQPTGGYNKLFSSSKEKFTKSLPGIETLSDVRTRVLDGLRDLEKKYQGKTVLIVSHEYPLWMLSAGAYGLSNDEALRLKEKGADFIGFAELQDLRIRDIPRNETGEADFHLPYVDEVALHCSCGSDLRRIKDVFDCWVESGSMPYAEKHYPFENRKLFEENFPADFIAEYIAQTRGWFYTLHVLSSALFGKPAFMHAVTTGTILSEKGEKLSKSKKNFPDPWILFSKYGVDAIRYYLMSSSVMIADNINFSERDVDEVYKKYSLISWNVLQFYKLYEYRLSAPRLRGQEAGLTGKSKAPQKPTHALDRWILSRLHSTIARVTDAYDRYEIIDASRPLLDFVQDLSLWYVRRSRERVKADSPDAISALTTLERVLYDYARIIAPVTPFLAEIIYQEIRVKKKLSVHLEDWPKTEKKLIDAKLEKDMEVVRSIVSEALRLRAEAGIKVRQPLASLQIRSASRRTKSLPASATPKALQAGEIRNQKALIELIKEEVNVKNVTFGGELELDTAITPELREEGFIRELIRNIQEMRKDAGLKPRDRVALRFSGEKNTETLLSRWDKIFLTGTNAESVAFGKGKKFLAEKEIKVENFTLRIEIDKI